MAALASGIADDFNNILTTVMAACSLIEKDDPANGELLQCVALIRTSAERAAGLSDRLVRAGTLEQENGQQGEKPQNSGSDEISLRDKKAYDDIVFATKHSNGALS